MNKVFKNKKGLTLIELLVTLLLVSIIVVFIYRLILNVNSQTTNPEFAMANQTIRTEIIRTIESDLVAHDVDKISLVYQDENNNYNPAVYFYEEERTSIISIIDEQAIQYKAFNGEKQTWELIDCYFNFNTTEKGQASGIVINSNGIGNSTSSVTVNFVISNDNEHNQGLSSTDNNLKDDIIISYLGHSNNLSFCSRESTHKEEECRKYVLIYLDYNYPHKETESLISSDQVVGEPLDLPQELTSEGYNFLGWYNSKTGGNEVENNKIAALSDENLTIYAHWEPNTYRVSFNANGGINPDPEYLDLVYDTKYGDLATTTRRGYTFVGWYMGTSASSQQVTKDAYVKTALNHTLYAHWRPNVYTVTFDKNGGDHDPNPATKEVTYDAAYGQLATIERTGYDFLGWYTLPDGGDKVEATTIVQIIENQTLYAHWKAKEYKVTFNANGGVTPNPTTTKVTYDATYGTLAETSRVGYTFDGWWTKASGGTKVEETTKVKITANQTLYAHWKANKYTITLTNSLATTNSVPTSVIATYDSPMETSITNPSRVYTITFKAGTSGATLSSTKETSTWTFNGWYTAQTGGSKVIGTDGKFVASVSGYTDGNKKWVRAENTTLFAQWKDGKIPIPTATRTGYSCSLPTITNPPTADKSYTATCTANGYTVTFNGNNCGTPSMASKSVTYDQTYGTLATITKTGYTFNGWFTKASGGTQVTASTTVKITANQTLYAHCTANQYTITLNNQNATTAGTTSVKATYDSANLSSAITNPSRVYTITFKAGTSGATLSSTKETSTWTFDGWYTSNGVKVIGTDGKLVANVSGYTDANKKWKNAGAVTLYAHWSGGSITIPTATKTGNTCTLGTVTNPPTANKEYRASCTPNKYTVTYNANNCGTASASTKQVTFGSAYGTLASFTVKTGYTFNGWYTAASGGTQVTASTTVSTPNNHSIYAHCTVKTYTITLSNDNATTVGTKSVTATYGSANLSASITNPSRVYTITFAAGNPAATLSATSATSTWTFTGWWTASSGGTKVIGTDGKLIANVSGYTNASKQWIKDGGATLYARWSGGTITVPTATRTGYTCTLPTITNPPTADKTYTASCTPNQCTLTLNNQYATTNGSTSVKVTYDSATLGSTVTSPQRKYTITFKPGSPAATLSATSVTSTWTFTGWYTAASGGSKVIGTDGKLVANVSGYTGAGGKWAKTGGVTLYAHWSGGTITVPTASRTGYTCTLPTVTNPPTANATYTATCTDKTKPSISCSKSNTGTTSGVTFTCTCSDNGSGVKTCAGASGSSRKITGVKSSTTYKAVDNAGNESAAYSASVTSYSQAQKKTQSCTAANQCTASCCGTYSCSCQTCQGTCKSWYSKWTCKKSNGSTSSGTIGAGSATRTIAGNYCGSANSGCCSTQNGGCKSFSCTQHCSAYNTYSCNCKTCNNSCSKVGCCTCKTWGSGSWTNVSSCSASTTKTTKISCQTVTMYK